MTTEPATSKPTSAKEIAAVASLERYPELFRRVLLGATIALLTARMLAPGEDPGLLQVASGSANLVFPLLWLLAAAGLTLWRVWSRGGDWRGGVVETALLVAVGLAFISAETAGYQHPARLIAWDWLTLFLVVCLVRQLTVSPRDQNALFAVFLAGAVALSVQVVYQGSFQRVPASATFAEPGAFAAWLALFLPGICAAVVVCRFDLVPRWIRVVGALLIMLGVGAFTAAAISAYRQADATTPTLLETWRDTGKMIAAHPWLGVGAGNFSRAFALYQGPNVGAAVTNPRNFFLEIAATVGVFTLLAVLVALGAFFVKAGRWLFRRENDGDDAPAQNDPLDGGRWEYLLGGMFGLVLGFIVHMSTGDRSQSEILDEGWLACVRCVVWLAAFVLFDLLPWTKRVRVAALTLGVAAMLLVLCVAPGAGLPAVAVALWAAVALALNALPQPVYAVNRLALTRILPLFMTAAVALLFLLNVFNPVASSAENVQAALQAGKIYSTAAQKDSRVRAAFVKTKVLAPLAEAAKDDPDDARARILQANWNLVLWKLRAGDILQALACAHQAEKLDPHGAGGWGVEYQIRMEFARQLEAVAHQADAGAALGPAYRIFLEEARPPISPAERERIEEAKKKYRAAVKANKNNEINLFVAAVQYQEAAAVLEHYLPNAPNNAALRYQLAETLYKAREDDRCRKVAEETLQLDAAASHPLLTDEQRRKLNFWKDLPGTPERTERLVSPTRQRGMASKPSLARRANQQKCRLGVQVKPTLQTMRLRAQWRKMLGIQLGCSVPRFSTRVGEIADEINPVRLEAAAQTDGINSVRHGSSSVRMEKRKKAASVPATRVRTREGGLAGTNAVHAPAMYSRRGERPERDLERMFMPFSAAGRKGFQSAKMGERVKKERNGGKHDGEMDF